MFLFADFAIIQQVVKDNTFQPGVGMGFRFRNVNLNRFIQLMVAYYPGLNIQYQNNYNLLAAATMTASLKTGTSSHRPYSL